MSEPITTPAADADEIVAAPDLIIGIDEATGMGQVTLRADLTDSRVTAALAQAAGLDLPNALRVTTAGDSRAVWMSPDELLLIVPDAPATVAALKDRLGDLHHMALEVSDARSRFVLTGPLVGEVLAKGVPCDVSDRGFAPGMARRTHMAGLAIGLWRLSPETWEVVCFRSYAHHLRAWLEQTAVSGSEVGWA